MTIHRLFQLIPVDLYEMMKPYVLNFVYFCIKERNKNPSCDGGAVLEEVNYSLSSSSCFSISLLSSDVKNVPQWVAFNF